MAQYENVVAVILGGGAGSRLFPLTKERAKQRIADAPDFLRFEGIIAIAGYANQFIARADGKDDFRQIRRKRNGAVNLRRKFDFFT